jgi:isocitrate dehydrogenase
MLRCAALSTRRASSKTLLSRAMSSKIIWTHTDEAPALASYALLPVIQRFAKPAGVAIETADISVAARILAQFGLAKDELSELGVLAQTPEANIIKLPNVSASVPQLVEAIAELQSKGYDIPNFVQEPTTAAEKEATEKYSKVLGSSVNPVLREGNSDRRVAPPVKAYAQKNPHKMGKWEPASKTHVAHMSEGDFYSTEVSTTVPAETSVRIELAKASGGVEVLKAETKLTAGEVIDASVMRKEALVAYLHKEMADAKANDLMLSLHLKATMMKISDPILFGHAVEAFFDDVFAKHGDVLKAAGANPRNGLAAVLDTVASLPEAQKAAIEADIEANYAKRPGLAMVDSDRGITNLHVPSDVIIDASVPCVVRDSGKMWNKDNALEDTKLLIPDRSYARFYAAVMEDCKVNGQFDVATMGNVANVGLMAQKAEEYGSHDKTFEVPEDGTMRVVCTKSSKVLLEHQVAPGDIWRMCQTKDEPIKDWVRLAVSRARATGAATYFWLDSKRAHDASLIEKINAYLPEHDTTGLEIDIMPPVDAVKKSMERARKGLDTISVTGNVLRDYLTDLFPILELGTSAKMLSIVPLLAGGGLFETGAGGSAPKHVQQFVKEGHLRWDSLGEYLALAVSLEDLGSKSGNSKALLLGETLNEATGKLLDENKSPLRKVQQIDNRASTFYIAMYWAEAMAKRGDADFAEMAKQLQANEEKIVAELVDCQGPKVDIGGYWMPDEAKTTKAMRPSATLNSILGI